MRMIWVLMFSLASVPALKADAPPVSPEKVQAAGEAEKAGAYAAAEALLLEVVRDAEELGESDPRLAEALERLGGYYMVSKHQDLGSARAVLERALAIRERADGAESLEVAEVLNSLALAHVGGKGKGKEDADKAQPLIDRAREIYRKAGGPDSPGLADVLHTQALVLTRQSRLDDAEKKMLQALAIRERAFGPDDPESASYLDDLGNIHEMHMVQAILSDDFEAMNKQGEQAKGCFERALKIRDKAFEPDDPEIAEVLLELGALASMREHASDAEEPLRRWLEIADATDRPVDGETAMALTTFAESATERGDLDEGERRYVHAQKVLEEAEKLYPAYLGRAILGRLGIAMKQGKYDRAEFLLGCELSMMEDQLDLDDPAIGHARELLARSGIKENRDNADAPLLWNELRSLAKSNGSKGPYEFWDLLETQAKLLRLTSRAVPRVSREDVDYLKKKRIVSIFDYTTLENPDELSMISDFKGKIDDAGLVHLRGFASLPLLSLSGAGITDAGLHHLSGLRGLKILRLYRTRITGEGLGLLQSLPRLEDLTLTYARVDDSAVETLAEFPSLRKLSILHTRITPSGVKRLKGLRPDLEIEYEEGYHELKPLVEDQRQDGDGGPVLRLISLILF